jgi:branched-chain amino acid transport system substrate-binding protein
MEASLCISQCFSLVDKEINVRSNMSVISKAGTGFAVLAASALVLSGCAAAEEPAAEEPAAEEETTEESAAAEELSLTIGTALPVTGSLAFLGPPEEAGVALAAADINAAGAGLSIEIVYGD